MPSKEIVKQRQATRLKVLRKIYDSADGQINVGANRYELCQSLKTEGIEPDEVQSAILYLSSRFYLENETEGWVCISQHGIDAVEEAIQEPDAAHGEFPPLNIVNNQTINISGGNVGALQVGDNSTAHVSQKIGASAPEIADLLEKLHAEVSKAEEPQRTQALALVEQVKKEAKAPGVDWSKMNTFLGIVGTLVRAAEPIIKTIGELAS